MRNNFLIGSHVVCTLAFLQAMATKSFVCYTIHGEMNKSICDRIIRYYHRGFVYLEPTEFNSQFYVDIMACPPSNERTEESREIMNDDGEIQIVTTTYRQRYLPFPNVDTHQLQETFIERIRAQQDGRTFVLS